jgi:uncharacterized coiled-coil protein SlyX
MTCEQDVERARYEIGYYQRTIAMLKTTTMQLQGDAARMREQIAGIRGRASTATASAIAAPTTQPATQPQEERRGVGSGDLAQYAALARDITDMEARLDRLEAR